MSRFELWRARLARSLALGGAAAGVRGAYGLLTGGSDLTLHVLLVATLVAAVAIAWDLWRARHARQTF